MKILVDENIPYPTVIALRELGHNILDIRNTPDEGIDDTQLWQLAQNEERLLISTDKGFGQYRNQPHYGILIIRLRQPNLRKIHHHIMQAFAQFSDEKWPGLLVIMRDYAQSVWHSTGEIPE